MCPRAVSSSWRAVISPSPPTYSFSTHSRPQARHSAREVCQARSDGDCLQAARRAPMAWATWRSPLARWSSPRRRAAGWDCLLVVISSSSLALSIWLGPSAGRPTQATSRASQPARLPRTAGRRRSARAMFQMRPRTGGGGGPVPQAPPPTASPRRRVAGSVILQGWAGDPKRRAAPLPGLTAEAEPGSARLGLGWRFRPWLTSFGPPAFTEGPSSLLAFVAAGLADGRVLQSQWFAPTMYHKFMKTFSGNLKQGSQTSASGWDFLTNHAHVLVCVAHDSGIRLRDIAPKPAGRRELVIRLAAS